METILYTNAITGQNAGQDEVLDLLNDIIDRSLLIPPERPYVKLAHYIPQALEFLNDLTIPKNIPYNGYEWITDDMDNPGVKVTFKLIKRATSFRDVYELRINAHPLFFRTFFYIYHDVEYQYKIMTRAFIKTEQNPSIQQEAITETALQAKAFYENPMRNLKNLKLKNQ
ncbi:hypothetical protein [Brevibacillus halotolerans]|uniref:hypothetical protein n=1 Tax=Brevibacillus halotolerans TaxID=1507437 RepID=UPI0015EE8D65|nr:hypothetical protein [Brevibacillus halotolerans]MBA4535537.1 hypothetical protein [Brevibacillus halotolerans]